MSIQFLYPSVETEGDKKTKQQKTEITKKQKNEIGVLRMQEEFKTKSVRYCNTRIANARERFVV